MRTPPVLLRHAVRLLTCLLLLGGLVQSCSKPNSVLLVNVVDDSGALTNVTQLKVRVLVGTVASQFSVPMAPGDPIKFPTSFTVEIDRSNSGAVNVNVTAMSGSKTVSGTANLGMLNVGNESVVTVHLGFPPPDAGVDSGADGGADAPTDRGSDAPSDTGPRDVGGDVPTDLGSDVPPDGGAGGTGAGGSGMGGMGMGGSGMGGMGTGGMGVGGMGMGGMGVGGSGMGGDTGVGGDTGMGGDTGVGGDTGMGGDTGSDAGDAGDAGDADDSSTM